MSETEIKKAERIIAPVITAEAAEVKASERKDLLEAKTKIRLHAICIALAAIITVAVSFVPAGFVVHISGTFILIPSGIQEVLDRIFRL